MALVTVYHIVNCPNQTPDPLIGLIQNTIHPREDLFEFLRHVSVQLNLHLFDLKLDVLM